MDIINTDMSNQLAIPNESNPNQNLFQIVSGTQHSSFYQCLTAIANGRSAIYYGQKSQIVDGICYTIEEPSFAIFNPNEKDMLNDYFKVREKDFEIKKIEFEFKKSELELKKLELELNHKRELAKIEADRQVSIHESDLKYKGRPGTSQSKAIQHKK